MNLAVVQRILGLLLMLFSLTMLPPTRVMLNDLCAYRSVLDVVRASEERDAAAPVMPRVELTEDGGVLRL